MRRVCFTGVLVVAAVVLGSCATKMPAEDAVTTASKPVTITESLPYITANISYPQFSGLKEFSADIKQHVQQTYAAVKDEAKEFRANNPDSAIQYEHIVTSKILEDETYLNVLVTTYSYTGGAHGMTYLRSFVWNKAESTAQGIADASGLTLEDISAECIAQLKTRGFDATDGTWIAEGAAADEEHLGTFTVCDGTLTVYFEPYAVAPYAAGPQQVQIQLSR